MINCFIFEQNLVLVVITKAMLILDETLSTVKTLTYRDIDPNVKLIRCCNDATMGFVFALSANPDKLAFKHSHEGAYESSSWVVGC